MTTPATPSSPPPAGDKRNFVPVDETYAALTLEDRMRLFWLKNGKTVVAFVIVVLVGVIAKGGWDYLAAQKELEIGREYAAAGTPAKLQAFVAAHPDHVLAGVARLSLADEAYAANRSIEAVASYEQAMGIIKTGPLASRAKLGVAMAKLQAGNKPEGEAALKLLAADPAELKGTRIEAAYQLASLASVAGKADDVKKYSDQVMQLDANSPWVQRAMMLRATITAPVSAGAEPAVKLPPGGK